MKILIVHNSYKFRGGEDEVIRSEMTMLRAHGHKVVHYRRSNQEFAMFIRLVINLLCRKNVDSQRMYRSIKEIIKKEKPDIVHVHNTFYVINRTVYQACRDENVPVVQSLHNYRFLCPIAIFWRPGKGVCEECSGGKFKSAVKNRCWKNSRIASKFLVDIVQSYHEDDFLKTHVDHFIALNKFGRDKYKEHGFGECRFSIKRQFLHFDPGVSAEHGDYGLYAGGFFPYKGITTLLEAWLKLGSKYKLKLLGTGPLLEELKKKYDFPNIEFLGKKSPLSTLEYMKKSFFLVVPSECYEAGPRVMIEAFACGVPVLGSNAIGSINELIIENENGLIFKGGDPVDLAAKISFLFQNKEKAIAMGLNARKEFENKYTMEKNYPQLMKIYEEVLEERRRKNAGSQAV